MPNCTNESNMQTIVEELPETLADSIHVSLLTTTR